MKVISGIICRIFKIADAYYGRKALFFPIFKRVAVWNPPVPVESGHKDLAIIRQIVADCGALQICVDELGRVTFNGQICGAVLYGTKPKELVLKIFLPAVDKKLRKALRHNHTQLARGLMTFRKNQILFNFPLESYSAR